MRRLLVLALLLLLLGGCSSGPYKPVPVSGRLTLNGKPLANVVVLFTPVRTESNKDPGPGSGGVSDAEGRYTLKLSGSGSSGAVVGKHKVTFRPEQKDDSTTDKPVKTKTQLPTKWARKSQEIDVPAGGTDKADFELK
jgi:hypothetical protein